MLVNETKWAPAASLKRRKRGLGVPVHIKMSLILLNMPFILITIHHYTLLVISEAQIYRLYCLAIAPSWGEQLLGVLNTSLSWPLCSPAEFSGKGFRTIDFMEFFECGCTSQSSWQTSRTMGDKNRGIHFSRTHDLLSKYSLFVATAEGQEGGASAESPSGIDKT